MQHPLVLGHTSRRCNSSLWGQWCLYSNGKSEEAYTSYMAHWYHIFWYLWMDQKKFNAHGKNWHNHQHVWQFHKRSVKGIIPLKCWLPVGPYSTCIFTYLRINHWHVHKSPHWLKTVRVYVFYDPHDDCHCKDKCPIIQRLSGESLDNCSLAWLVESSMHLHIRLCVGGCYHST